MAGGKLSPRQKMINLMYLVFIAMLALNMSKEVLSAFGLMNEKLTSANTISTERNSAFMTGLSEKVSEQPAKYAPLKEKADQISVLSNDFNAYVEQIKSELLETADDPTDYETMDKPDALDTKFFEGGKNTASASEFLEKIKTYKEGVVSALSTVKEVDGQVSKDISTTFSTEDVKDRDGVSKEWLDYNFKGFPLVASITKLTQMQADVKTTETKVLSALLAGELQKDASATNYKAVVVPDKTAFFSGEKFKGRIVLARFDAGLKPTSVEVNGSKEFDVQNGQIMLDFPAGNVGERDIKGELQFKEGDSIVTIPIESSYAVIPKPNSAVISADKMNVVYRGVDNPMTISIPGVPSVSASAPGLKKSGGAGKYVMNVTTVKAREVSIKVNGKLPK